MSSIDPTRYEELASAALDGELAADELAAVADDPAFADALGVVRATREAVRAAPLPSIDAARRDEMLRVALAAADDDVVVPFAPVRPSRAPRRTWRWLLPVAGAAAAVAVVVGLVAGVRSTGGDGDDMATSATTEASDTLRAQDAGAAGGAAEAATDTTAAGGADLAPSTAIKVAPLVPEPVSEADLPALAQRVATGELARSVEAVACPLPADVTGTAVGVVTWADGRTAAVVVDADAGTVAAVALDSCLVLGRATFP